MNRLISLQDRSITPPSGDDVDYSETFTGNADVWAMVDTKRGETVFDGTNTERDVTHRFYIRYLSGITAETWIEENNIKYDILDVENLNEENRFMLLRASKRGSETKDINLT